MRAAILLAVVGLGGLSLASLQAAAQDVDARKEQGRAPTAQPPLSLRISDEVISKAVRETLAEQRGSPKPGSGRALSGDSYQSFSRQFSEAQKPGCLRPDAMKFQPAGAIFGGILALPFWAAAIVGGKCN
jgi:hypothetical protein